jgi:ubiquinone/menaquinone biosynthesis C-methylase UbiE
VDISRTFVELAKANARKAGVSIDVRQGDVHALPFPDGTFDFLVCRAAFKNFSNPVKALAEMRRVLKPEGRGLIIDMRRDIPDVEIDEFVRSRPIGWLNARIISLTFKHMLRKRAYRASEMQDMARQAGFSRCDIEKVPLGMEVSLQP